MYHGTLQIGAKGFGASDLNFDLDLLSRSPTSFQGHGLTQRLMPSFIESSASIGHNMAVPLDWWMDRFLQLGTVQTGARDWG